MAVAFYALRSFFGYLEAEELEGGRGPERPAPRTLTDGPLRW